VQLLFYFLTALTVRLIFNHTMNALINTPHWEPTSIKARQVPSLYCILLQHNSPSFEVKSAIANTFIALVYCRVASDLIISNPAELNLEFQTRLGTGARFKKQ